jgi:NAD(P)H-hydrate epimerase
MSIPGANAPGPLEAVGYPLGDQRWSDELQDIDRFGAAVLGPGLGRADQTSAEILRALSRLTVPTVVDGDALSAIGTQVSLLRSRNHPTVLTPHDGEYERLMGKKPGADRFEAARQLASKTSCVALLKGPATIVSDPEGNVLVANSGDERLATAGTGDVLAGAIAALLAQGVPALQAAAGAAWLHGAAGSLSPRHGMVASDLLVALPEVLHEANLG